MSFSKMSWRPTFTARKTSLNNIHNDPISANIARMNKVPMSR